MAWCMSCLFEFCGLFAKRIMWSIISDSISLLVCEDSGPHMSAGPLRDEITSGVPTFHESNQYNCVSLTPSSCDSRVYMFYCWWCDSCYLTNVVVPLFLQYFINQWKIHQFLLMKLNICQVFTTLYNKMKDLPRFYNII